MFLSVQCNVCSIQLWIFSCERSLATSLRNQTKMLTSYLGCSPCHSSPPNIHKGTFPSHQCILHHGYMDWTNKRPSSQGSQLQFHCQQHNCQKENLLLQQYHSLGKILNIKQIKLLFIVTDCLTDWPTNYLTTIWHNPKVHNCIHKILPFAPLISQINPVHALLLYLLHNHLNIILPSLPRSSRQTLSFRFPHQISCRYFSSPPHLPMSLTFILSPK